MFFNYQDYRLYYEIKGKGNPIIFLHGWGTSSDTFINIIDPLIPSYKVILIDLPSFGNSKEPSSSLDIKEVTNIIFKFINQLNIVSPIIVGHSYGGRVAIEYAASYKNIKSLILIDAAGIKHNSLKKVFKVFTYKIKKKYYKVTKQLMKYQNLIQESGSIDYQNASPIQKEMLIKAVNYNQKKLLKKITCDVLIIFGENDQITKVKDAYIFHKKIKKSGVVIIPHAGHFPYLENPYYFIKVLKNYLEV